MLAERKALGPLMATRGWAWTEAEDELVRTLRPAEAARATGRTLGAVYNRRQELKVPDGRAINGRRSGQGSQ